MFEGQLVMVSECTVNGSINEFVKANPDVNWLKRVSWGTSPEADIYSSAGDDSQRSKRSAFPISQTGVPLSYYSV